MNHCHKNKILLTSVTIGAIFIAYKIDCYSKEARNLAKMKYIRKKGKSRKKAFFIGGGLASMAGAAYLIRDCNFDGF